MKMKKLIKIALLLLLLIFLVSGCSGKRYSLTLSQPKTDFKQPGKVLIVTQDKRPFVVNGEKSSDYVGKWFGGNGASMNVSTRSGKSVSEEIGKKIEASLTENGFYVRSSMIASDGDFTLSDPNFVVSEYDRVMFFAVDLFKAESHAKVDLQWEFHLKIYDDKGSLLAQADSTDGRKGLRRNHIGSMSTGRAQKAINTQTDTILAQMLSTVDVKKALNIENSKKVAGFDENGNIITREDGTAEVADIIALRKQLNSAEIADLLKQLTFGDAVLFEKSAKEIFIKGVTSEDDLDFLAEIIWQNRDKRDRKSVNGLCYLCKVFIKNKNPRYKTFFEQLRKEGKTRKLRKYAIKTLRYFSSGVVEQFVPGQGEQSVSL